MKCCQCEEDRKDQDFYNSSICYKCTFKNKTFVKLQSDSKKPKDCKICKKEIPNSKLIYWKACYCSYECSKRGKDLHNKNYWVRNCNAPKVQKEFQYGKSK